MRYHTSLEMLIFRRSVTQKQKKPNQDDILIRLLEKKPAATYSPILADSTIGAGGLNYSVRYGKR